MLYLEDVREYISSIGITVDDNVYMGKLDNKKLKSVGVYQLQQARPPTVNLGDSGTYKVKPISLLIHWNKSARDTEKIAYQLYEQLRTVRGTSMNGTAVFYIQMLQEEPVDVGTDDSGVYERVIEINIFYER